MGRATDFFCFCFHEIRHGNSLGEEESEDMMELMEINEFCRPSGLGLFTGLKNCRHGHGRGCKLVRWEVGIKEKL